VQIHAIDQQFLGHAKRDAVLADQGLTAGHIAEAAMEHIASGER
jgi:deoxyxylulose-5-phosphate synthase